MIPLELRRRFKAKAALEGKDMRGVLEELVAPLRAPRQTQGQSARLIFPNADGEPLHIQNLSRRVFKSILARARLPDAFRLYDLRHTCATLLLLAGMHPKVVSDRLGHSSISETMDTYSHIIPGMQREASDKLDAMLFREPKDRGEARAFN